MVNWQDEVWRVASRVELEWMTPNTALAIGSLFQFIQPKRILEIGTFKGTGACYLAAMAACYGGQVTTVDLPWTAKPNKHFERVAEYFIDECKLTNVTIIRREDGAEGFLKDHFLNNDPPYDFIYIDGGHKWLHTAAQYAMSVPAVRSGAWLCFDDIKNDSYPDVGLVWNKIVKPRHKHYENNNTGFAMIASGGE